MNILKLWTEQCEAAEGIEAEFGTQQSLGHLIRKKFFNFLEATETDAGLRAEIPAFVAGIKTILEPWQLEDCLATARQTGPFDPEIYEGEDDEFIQLERHNDLRRSAAGLFLVERAKEWLLDGGEG